MRLEIVIPCEHGEDEHHYVCDGILDFNDEHTEDRCGCPGGGRWVWPAEEAEEVIARQIARLCYDVGEAVEYAERILAALKNEVPIG